MTDDLNQADEPDWAKLQSALQAAEQRAGMSRTVNQAFATVSPNQHFHADPNAGSEDIAAAKAPLELARARQEFERGQQQTEATRVAAEANKEKAARDAEADDPASPKSQRAREAIKTFFKDTPLPASIDQWSANDVNAFVKNPLLDLKRLDVTSANTKAINELRGGELGLRTRAADDKAAGEKTAADAAAASLDNERALLPADPRAKKLGITAEMVANLDRKGLEGVRHQIESMPREKGSGGGAQPMHVKQGDYSSVPEELRNTVQAIVEGRAKAPEPGTRFGAKVLAAVNAIDPTFDASKYGAYKDVREKLAKSDEVVALNTAYEHLGRAEANIPENFDGQALNRIKQAFLTGAGSDKLTPFETDVKIAADELAKAYGNNSEAGRSTIEHLLEANQSRAQLQARLHEARELLAGKLKSYQHQFNAVAPKGASFNLVPTESAGGGGDTVTVVSKKTGKSKQMSKAAAQALISAAGGDGYEVH